MRGLADFCNGGLGGAFPLILVLFLALVAPASSLAQVTTGLPPFGSFGGAPDVVDNANLNVYLGISIVSKAGRGLPFYYVLANNSAVWSPQPSGSSTVWTPVGNWGWGGITSAATGWVTYAYYQGKCYSGKWYYWNIYQFLAYYDPNGTPHAVSTTVSTWNSLPCGSGPPYSATALANDGSGYTLSMTASPSAVVYTRSGQSINAPLQAPTGNGSVYDSNGNYLTVASSSGTTTFTDTLGKTALTVTGSGTPTSPLVYQYTTPSGGQASFTVNYAQYTVQTNFGCSGIVEYGAQTDYLVSSVSLPDGTSYAFSYEATPGYGGNVTGRIASVTLPTGGKISYSYSGGSHGIRCADGSTATLTRTTPDGTWTYAHSENGTAWTTNITAPADPQGNQAYTILNFQGIYETERQSYQKQGGTLLETVTTCYNGNPNPCTSASNTTSITLPITQRIATTTLPAPGGGSVESERNTNYDTYGLPTEVDEYAYGNGGVGGLARKTLTTYQVFNALNEGQTCKPGTSGYVCFERPSEVQVYQGSTLQAQTQYTYSNNFTGTSGTPQHTNPAGDRANVVPVTESTQGSSTIKRSISYHDTGTLNTATDFNANTTTYNYGTDTGKNCGNAFPISVSLPLSLSRSATWNCNAGLASSVTDENGQQTSLAYDEFFRPTQVSFPDSGQTTWTYNDTASNIVKTMKLTSSSNRQDTVELDGLGRVKQSQLNSDPAGTDYADTSYDALGWVASVSHPYRSGSSTGSETWGYDALGRVTSVKHTDGNSATVAYGAAVGGTGVNTSQLCSSSTNGLGYPALFIDEAGHQRETWTDALGRTIEVDEANPGSSNYLNWNTCYSYDGLDDLTQVAQGSQTRTYGYDMLGRVTSAKTPEGGNNTRYFYYTTSGGSLCAGDPRAVCRRLDERSITTTYAYDALNRLTSKSYNDNPQTPTASYSYDLGSVWGESTTNAKGRLVLAQATSGSTLLAGNAFESYDAMGRIKVYRQCTPSNCGTSDWRTTYNCDLAGDVSSSTHPAGFTLTNTWNGAQQITQIASTLNDSTHPPTLVESASYTPFGALATLVNGAVSGGLQRQETYDYNNRLQPVRIQLGQYQGNLSAYSAWCTITMRAWATLALAWSLGKGRATTAIRWVTSTRTPPTPRTATVPLTATTL